MDKNLIIDPVKAYLQNYKIVCWRKMIGIISTEIFLSGLLEQMCILPEENYNLPNNF